MGFEIGFTGGQNAFPLRSLTIDRRQRVDLGLIRRIGGGLRGCQGCALAVEFFWVGFERVKRGTQFAVCDMATHFFAGQLAMMSGGNADAVYKELASNTIPNSHMVAAGVVAVNRAQEYGYTLLTAL